jgi:hypothetical protein
MNSVRKWAVGSAIAALILFSPVIAFLMVIVAEMQIDLLMEAGTAADCTIVAIGIGWVLYRKFWPHPEEAPQWELEQEPDQAAIAAPPT